MGRSAVSAMRRFSAVSLSQKPQASSKSIENVNLPTPISDRLDTVGTRDRSVPLRMIAFQRALGDPVTERRVDARHDCRKTCGQPAAAVNAASFFPLLLLC